MYLFELFYMDSLFYNTHEGTRVRLLVFLFHKMACIGFLNFKRTKARVRLSLSFPVPQNAAHRLLEL